MAIEKNPFDKIPEEIQNVIPIPKKIEDTNATFEVEPDGGVTVDFTEVSVEMQPEPDIEEWYGNMANDMEEEELQEIAATVIDNYRADKDSRADWESMFERGFDLLGPRVGR